MSDTHTHPCRDIQTLLASYALGEVDLDNDILAHLAACPSCQHDLRSYIHVIYLPPCNTPDATPPTSLRHRILCAASPPAPTPTHPKPPTSPSIPTHPHPHLRHIITITTIIALIALTTWNLLLHNQLRTQTAQIVANHTDWRTLTQLLNNPRVQRHTLDGPHAQGHLWNEPHSTIAYLIAQNLPPLATNQTYQIWLTQNHTPSNVGTLITQDNTASLLIHTNEPITTYDSITVTIEPNQNTQKPTGQIILRGTLNPSPTPPEQHPKTAKPPIIHRTTPT